MAFIVYNIGALQVAFYVIQQIYPSRDPGMDIYFTINLQKNLKKTID
jgi:hypothetical protein